MAKRSYLQKRRDGHVTLTADPQAPDVVLLQEKRFDPNSGADLGIGYTQRLTRDVLIQQLADVKSEAQNLAAILADFDAVQAARPPAEPSPT
jgi:hypothetical protein